jgi:hypothetical protein
MKKKNAAKARTVTEGTLIKMIAADPLLKTAWQIARILRRDPDPDEDSVDINAAIAGNMIALYQDSPDFHLLLKHIASPDITDITKWPRPDDSRTIMAYNTAKRLAGVREGNGGFDPFVLPSFEEVRIEFIGLFPKIKLPADWTIRKQLKRRGLPLRRVPGRPKGSKDRLKRKRRNNRLQKRPH